MLKLSAQHVKTRQIATAHNQAINKRLDRIEAAIKVIRCDLDEIMGKKAPGG
jgi:tetrahydromethanopterin S-methyltransferase subunit G